MDHEAGVILWWALGVPATVAVIWLIQRFVRAQASALRLIGKGESQAKHLEPMA